MGDVEQPRRRGWMALAGIAAPIAAVAVVALISAHGRHQPPAAPAPTGPADEMPIVSKAAVAADPRSGALLLVGCCDEASGSPEPASTWLRSGRRWTHLHPVDRPPFHPGAALAFDPRTSTAVLQGGEDSADTWTWDGRTWTRLSPPATPPPGPAVMTGDPVTGALVLLTGSPGADVTAWSWDGRTWTRIPAPPASGAFALAADPAHGRLVAVAQDGCALDQTATTWTSDGRAWASAPGPPCDASTQVGWDPVSGSVIAILLGDTANPIGFSAEPATTWRWSGTTWSRVTTTAAPEETGRLVSGGAQRPLFVSDRRTAGQPDLWVWAGAGWSPHHAGAGVGVARPLALRSWDPPDTASMEGDA
jgi:hypothetical protein